MLTGVYQWDREPVKEYIRRHAAEPPCGGVMDMRYAPLFFRLHLHVEVPGRVISVRRARLVLSDDGSWTLKHHDFDAQDWIPCAIGDWHEDGQAVSFSVREVLGEVLDGSERGELEVEGERLLIPRWLAGSLFGLIGFRLVSPLPEPKSRK